MQNRSHAVMAQRTEPMESRDDFPTPPWATRALMEHVLSTTGFKSGQTCLEPACGRGYMDSVLQEYFSSTDALDIFDYGYGEVGDFLATSYEPGSHDWVITNPPFKLAEEYIQKALPIARTGVAILARTVFLESKGRHERLFESRPPHIFAPFVERVPMVKGRLDSKASTATAYAWFVWLNVPVSPARVVWIPPCRKILERSGDYTIPCG
jgi:hypothetical protein